MKNAVALLLALTGAALPGAHAVAQNQPPTRPADGPGAPKWTVIDGAGKNAPADANGDFLIGPDYIPAPELTPLPGVPQGKVDQFLMKSADSKIYPKAIAREKFGTPDPANPRTLIVETHEKPWERAITVYIPEQLKADVPAALSGTDGSAGARVGVARLVLARHGRF
jgi:enterochelin esterase family protein